MTLSPSNMRKTTRRKVVSSAALLSVIGISGCTQSESEIQDTDGDGVIDSEDYAPRDPSVQRKEQVEDDSSGSSDKHTDEEESRQPTDGIVAESELISRWPFRSSYADTAGGNDISIDRGTPDLGTHNGRPSVALDGSVGMMIDPGTNAELSIMAPNQGGSSIGGWIYFDRTTGSRHPKNNVPPHTIFRNDAEYILTGQPAGNEVELKLTIMSQVEGVKYTTDNHVTDEMIVPTNQWNHFMYVIDPQSSIEFYLNGVKQFEDNNMPGYSPNASQYWSHETVGSWYGTRSPDWYKLMIGKISDLRIYDTGLSGNQVAQIVANTS